MAGPETVDKAILGCTRHVNTALNTIDFTRFSTAQQNLSEAEKRESVIFRLHPEREGSRLIYQIGTANPELAVKAASMVAGDVAGIDVNAGCPKPFSTLGGMGAALLKTPDTLCAILEALVKEVGGPHEIGISVKIRLLDTPEETGNLVRRLCATGITGLTIHCRTTPMRPRERAIRDQLSLVAQICRDAGIACLANGDVTDRDAALALAEEHHTDGAMIATAAEKNPSCFRSKVDGGMLSWRDTVALYVKTALEVENRWGNTKFLLSQMIPGKVPEYRLVTQCRTYSDIVRTLKLDDLKSLASSVDTNLELDGLTRKEKTKKAKETKATEKAHAQKPAKRKADEAELDDRPIPGAGPGTLPEQASVLMV